MKRYLILFFLSAFFFACKKELKNAESDRSLEASKLGSGTCSNGLTKLAYLKILTEQMLTTAKYSGDFKKYIYSECFSEKYGDNYVRVSDLLSYNAQNRNVFWTDDQSTFIQCVVDKIKQADDERPEEPIVFVPFVEDINIDSLISYYPTDAPEGVIADEYDSTSRECYAYTLDSNDDLIKGQARGESYAWSHDLWVIGQEETVSEASRTTVLTQGNSQSRFNGQSEKGGIINITDIGAIEGWTAGKVELKFFVFNQSGTKTNEIALGKIKRKNVKDTWKDTDKFLFYWNVSNIGNYLVESWIEEDGGNSTSTVTSSLAAPCSGCPSTSISFTKQKHDDEMGATIIQFTDPISTEYNISYAKIKHKN